MQTISEMLKDARVTKNLSLSYLERVTKIKSTFIDAIERADWDNLPPFPTVLGFVKSLSTTLTVDPNLTVALLKRDYPPKKLRISPKPDVATKFAWSPKLTFAVGVSAILIILVGYLAIQYFHFVSAPALSIDSPKENQVITSGNVDVFGTTDSDAKIVINNQPVEVSLDGKFNISLKVVPETKQITVRAESRSGKVTIVSRKITVN